MTSSCLLLATKEALVTFWLTSDEVEPLERHFLWPRSDDKTKPHPIQSPL